MEERVSFDLKGNTYTIEMPNVGQMRDLAVQKEILSAGMYGSMVRTMLDSTNAALDAIDIEATLRVMCPDLLQDMKVEFNKLGVKDFSEIRKVYAEKILPFLKEVEKLMQI